VNDEMKRHSIFAVVIIIILLVYSLTILAIDKPLPIGKTGDGTTPYLERTNHNSESNDKDIPTYSKIVNAHKPKINIMYTSQDIDNVKLLINNGRIEQAQFILDSYVAGYVIIQDDNENK
jgi:hypothetical protein